MAKKNQYIFFGLAAVGLLLIANTAKAATNVFNSLASEYGQDVANSLSVAYQALQSAGITGEAAKLALSQVMFETAENINNIEVPLTSDLSISDNNFSGIKWINDTSTQLNSYQAGAAPDGGYFAGFNTPKDWAVDYARVVELGSQDPLAANNVSDFANALKQNGYYTGNESDYAAGMDHFYTILTSVNI